MCLWFPLKCHRFEEFGIKGNLWKNQQTIQDNKLGSLSRIGYRISWLTWGHNHCKELLSLLRNWFGRRCIQYHVPNMVRFADIFFLNYLIFSRSWGFRLKKKLCWLRLPFDWKTPFKYPLAIIFESSHCYATGSVCSTYMNLLIGCCFLLMQFAKELRADLKFVNGIAGGEENRSDITHKLCEFLRFHATVNQLSLICLELRS